MGIEMTGFGKNTDRAKRTKWLMSFRNLLAVLFCVLVTADSMATSANPTMKSVKWRIGCYQGGEFRDYDESLKAILLGLMELGWIKKADISKLATAEELWKWASTGDMESDYLRFVENAFYNARWGRIGEQPENGKTMKEVREQIRNKTKEEILSRLNGQNDLDLMIAMGTWAGQDLANNRHSVPVIIVSCSDPIASGIIKSAEDSGFDHVHARIDPFRYERQICFFQDFVGFEKLGMAYQNTPLGRTYAAIDKARKVALERNFSIVSKHVDYETEMGEVENNLIASYRELCSEADSIYVTMQSAVNRRTVPILAQIAIDRKIPTFSMAGPHEVRAGFLMSVASPNFERIGLFHAGNISKILNGAKPRELKQVFEESPRIAINLKTARLIGYKVPSFLMDTADIKYDEIEPQ